MKAMADFKATEMATIRLDVGEIRGAGLWRKGVRLGVTMALLLTFGSFLMSGVCLWNQRKVEVENIALRQDVDILKTKMQAVDERLSEVVPEGKGGRNDAPSISLPVSLHSRLRRSQNNDQGRQNRRRNREHNHTKAVHFRLDAADGGSTNELRWKIWTELDQVVTDSIHLSTDKKSVTINEAGTYYIYAQVHFENAKPRNAFAVKVDDSFIMKCFQSLDYFNHSLTSTENSRLKPCYSASVVVLRKNQVVTIVNLYPSHRIYNDPYANFWGIVKLGDN